MHRLLERQLKKILGPVEKLDPVVQKFVEAVDAAYVQSDDDRAMLERSMEFEPKELLERNSALTEAEKKYRSIFENATEGIFRIAPEGHFISANPAIAQIFGYETPTRLMASVPNFSEKICIDPARREQFLEALRRDGAASQFESQAQREDGKVIWVSTSIRPARDNSNRIVHFEGTLRDATKRKQAELDRQEMQSHMMSLSRQAGMAEVATGVLHNVGNVLNSVNVSASLASEKLRASKLSRLAAAMGMFKEHENDLVQFLTSDEKGKQLPTYLIRLADHLATEQVEILKEIDALVSNLEHVKKVVTMQQDYARTSGVNESVSLPNLVEDAIRLNVASFERHQIELVCQIEPLPQLSLDKHRVLQILINLISNARHALTTHHGRRILTILAGRSSQDPNRFFVQIRDTGVGIPAENMTRIFAHGFTTKADGHGFGLHSAALAAKGMSGSLTAQSDGPGKGATFTLELPMVLAEAESSEVPREKAA